MKAAVPAFALAAALAGCAPLAAQHQADAAFRRGLAAQLAGDDARAEAEYDAIVALGRADSLTLNNLGVLAVKRHAYIAARHLFARAVAADERDLVALTNYGVLSYWLADLGEARRTLADARALRRRLIDRIPSEGRDDWEAERWARVTAPLDDVAARYLSRLEHAGGRAALSVPELVASLTLHRL